MLKLQTNLHTEVEGVTVEYGQIPSGLIDGWDDDLVFFLKANDTYDTEKHERIIGKVIEQLQSQSYDHGSEWRKTHIDAPVWDKYCQITLVGFRIRDSY
jgi:hypothetical protein